MLLRRPGDGREPPQIEAALLQPRIICSSASTHSSGGDAAVVGSSLGSTPCRVPYCGNVLSNAIDDSKASCRQSPSMSRTIAEKLWVLESRPQ